MNRLKVLRAAVRLKHSIAADEELNTRVTAERKKFYAAVQAGRMLPPLDPAKVINS